MHDARRDHHHQLGRVPLIRTAAEQVAEDWNVADARYSAHRLIQRVVEQPRDGKRLAVAQLDFRIRFSRGQRGNAEPGDRHRVVEIEGAHFRRDLEMDHVVTQNRRREVQPDTELFEDNRHRRRAALRLHDRIGIFAARQKRGFLAVLRNQVRLGEALEEAFVLQRLDQRAELLLRVERKEIQEIAEHEAFRGVEVRRAKLLGRRAADPIALTGGTGEERRPQFLHRASAHFRKAHLQQYLVGRHAVLLPKQVDHVVRLVDVADGQRGRAVCHVFGRHDAGEHNVLSVAPYRDRLARKQSAHLLLERAEVAAHGNVEGLDAPAIGPHEQRNGARRFAVDQQLARRGRDRIGDVGGRERHADDGPVHAHDGRTSHQQINPLGPIRRHLTRSRPSRSHGEHLRLQNGRHHDDDEQQR